jgi:hypothetical protein
VRRRHWCDTVLLSDHTPAEDKVDDTKASYYVELQ